MFGLKGQFKRLKTKDIPSGTLERQRARLEVHMSAHPMRSVPRAGSPFTVFAFKPLITAFIVALIFSGTGGVVLASQTSLPGEALYPVKIVSEEVRVRLSLSEEAKFRYRSGLAEKRLMEAEELIGLPVEAVSERDRKVSIAMRRYEQHVARLNLIAERFEAKDRPKDPSRAFEAMSRVLETHARLLESATATGAQDDTTVAAYAGGAIDLEEKFMRRLDVLEGFPKDFDEKRERMRKNSESLREHLKEAEAVRSKALLGEEDDDRRWPKAWASRDWLPEEDEDENSSGDRRESEDEDDEESDREESSQH